MNRLKKYFKNMPVALTGLALGVAGISGALASITHSTILYIGITISTLLITPIIVKNFLHFNVLKEELAHPTLGSFIPTLDMVLMNIAVVICKFSPFIGKSLWLFAIGLHAIFCISFMYHRFQNWDIEHMVPSWFVPPIGVVVASVTSTSMGMPQLSQIIFYIGFVFYIIMLPFMLYRVIFVQRIDDGRLPTFAIMAAPPNLCLAGYLVAFQNPNIHMVRLLFPLGLFMTFLVYVSMFRIFKVKFSPVYASFTFPLAIGATALLKYSAFISKIDPARGQFWRLFGIVDTIMATILISIIFFNIVKIVIKQVHEIRKNHIHLA